MFPPTTETVKMPLTSFYKWSMAFRNSSNQLVLDCKNED